MFISHICWVVERKLFNECNCQIEQFEGDLIELIHPNLHEFFWTRTVDAMEWILRCSIGDVEFDQDKEDEIPILRDFHNEFIGVDKWSDDDHTMMTILNRYYKIKTGRYGNFGLVLEEAKTLARE